jgi:hypothetical protein
MKNKIKIISPFLITVLILLCPVSISNHLSNSIICSEDDNENILTLNSFNVSIVKPKGFLYIFNIPLVPLPSMMPLKGIIIGSVTVSVSIDAEIVDNVEFYVDNQLKHNTSNSPYEWTWNEGLRPPPIYQLKVVAYSGDEVGMDEIRVLYINPF